MTIIKEGGCYMNTRKEGVDPLKYPNVCSEEDLDLDDFMSRDNYFGCPLKNKKIKEFGLIKREHNLFSLSLFIFLHWGYN